MNCAFQISNIDLKYINFNLYVLCIFIDGKKEYVVPYLGSLDMIVKLDTYDSNLYKIILNYTGLN